MGAVITIIIIGLILFRSVRRALPATPIDAEEEDRGYSPEEILRKEPTHEESPQPQSVNIRETTTQKQEVKNQIIEEETEEVTFDNEEIRRGIIMAEILNRREI